VWIDPSPQRRERQHARAYAGTVILEGTTLSEGRGTTRPLALFGAPEVDATAVIVGMRRIAPAWLSGCTLRNIWFQPTFHKHVGQLCAGVFIHAEGGAYDHEAFRRGGCRRRGSRRSATSTRATTYGATSRTNMCSTSLRST
jgi:uncharacterized protein YbbC (DUF1343 family)